MITRLPPVPEPKKRLNAFGKSKPDNRPAAPPRPRSRRGERAKRPAPLDLAALQAQATLALSRDAAERALKGYKL